MEALELATLLAEPIGVLGMSFYFDPQTRERGRALGLGAFEYYGLGRGGTLGDVDTDTVDAAFTFFHPSTIDAIWTSAKQKADPVATAQSYLIAAYEFADRTFGAIDLGTLAGVAGASRRVVEATAPGRCPLVDGYRRFPAPADPVHGAYLGTIMLRELRGGLHIAAVRSAHLDPAASCYLDDPALFALHGYSEADAPVVSAELEDQRARAETSTTEAVAECLGVLGDVERRSLAEGTLAMFAALAEPVAVAP